MLVPIVLALGIGALVWSTRRAPPPIGTPPVVPPGTPPTPPTAQDEGDADWRALPEATRQGFLANLNSYLAQARANDPFVNVDNMRQLAETLESFGRRTDAAALRAEIARLAQRPQ